MDEFPCIASLKLIDDTTRVDSTKLIVSNTLTAIASDSLYNISISDIFKLEIKPATVVMFSGIGIFNNMLFILFSNQVTIVDL